MKIKYIVVLGLAVIVVASAISAWRKKSAGPEGVPLTVEPRSSEPAKTEAPAGAATAPANQAAAASVGASGIALSDAAGTAVASIEPGSPTTVSVASTGKVFQAGGADKGKRKYKLPGGSTAYEIKDKDEGFKLRDPDGKLLWKVKFSESGKTKVSDNEENEHPIVLKSHDGSPGSFSVEDDGVKLGDVRFDAATGETRINDAGGALKYQVKSGKAGAGFGLFLSARLPKDAAAILAAELLIRGR